MKAQKTEIHYHLLKNMKYGNDIHICKCTYIFTYIYEKYLLYM